MDLEQLCRDWVELEEDDECVFHPVALFDEMGREYQSFSLYQRDTVSRAPHPSQWEWKDEHGVEFWPVDVAYQTGQENVVLTMY
jgi:hypothetical protein